MYMCIYLYIFDFSLIVIRFDIRNYYMFMHFFNDKAIVIMLSIIRIELEKTNNILFTIVYSVYYCTHVLYWTIMYLLYNTM